MQVNTQKEDLCGDVDIYPGHGYQSFYFFFLIISSLFGGVVFLVEVLLDLTRLYSLLLVQ